jgi:nucleotide-binding universal stress UspA family protein
VSTRVHPTQSTRQDSAGRPIVVGVDQRGRSASALVWAVDAAEQDGSRLQLVTAAPSPFEASDPTGQHDLGTLARRLSLLELEERTVGGTSVDVLLDAARDASQLVVGCRNMSPAQRILLGGTSRAVATWSPVPVVIVPEAWIQPSMATAPIVVGVRPDESVTNSEAGPLDAEVLDFAFARASKLRVPLVVVSAYEPARLQAWSPDDLAHARAAHDNALADRLEHWTSAYPDVELTTYNVAEPADKSLVEAARVAQLAVIGRHHSRSLSGLLGSTARSVLRNVGCPVAVVPSGGREELVRELTDKRTREGWSWAPTF